MSRYKAYPKYKESNIGWMGAVPEGWSITPCRAVVEDIAEKNVGATDQNYLSVMANVGVIKYEDKGDVGNKKPDDLSKCKIVKAGNLVINSMNYAIGSYGMSPYNGVCSPVYIVLGVNEDAMELRFALRIFENTPFQKYLATFGNGILEHRAAIGWDDIKGAHIAVPSKDEQRAILNFLDHETAKIDALIEKQQRLIELLKEKRQAVISHAVTKGLNSNAPMKDSGVEWLGEVPAHWGVLKLGYLMKLKGGAGFPDSYQGQEGHEIPFYKVGDLARANSESCLTEPWHTVTHETAKELRATIFSTGSIVFAKVGAALLLKRFCTLKKPSCIDNNMMGAELGFIELREFLLFLMPLLDFELIVNPGAVPSVNGEQITSILIALPPQDEQIEIVDFLKAYRIKFDHLISNAEQAISLFQERRTALISAAVTGKIDVRDWQAAA